MFKKSVLIIAATLLFIPACVKKTQDSAPTHRTIHVGSRSNAVNLMCGDTCALVRSEDDTTFVAIFADGSTVTFTFDE